MLTITTAHVSGSWQMGVTGHVGRWYTIESAVKKQEIKCWVDKCT